MNDMENKILSFLEKGNNIDKILQELTIDEEILADMIINLELKEFIILKDKNWTLTEKGLNILEEQRKELLKKLKIEHMYGNIDLEEFQKKKEELEPVTEKIIEEQKKKEELEPVTEKIEENKIICPNCGKENKVGSKYCSKCGRIL